MLSCNCPDKKVFRGRVISCKLRSHTWSKALESKTAAVPGRWILWIYRRREAEWSASQQTGVVGIAGRYGMCWPGLKGDVLVHSFEVDKHEEEAWLVG